MCVRACVRERQYQMCMLCYSIRYVCYSIQYVCYSIQYVCCSIRYVCYSIRYMCYCIQCVCCSIFGHEGSEADDVIYVNWLNMVRAGLLALEFYAPDTSSWMQVW